MPGLHIALSACLLAGVCGAQVRDWSGLFSSDAVRSVWKPVHADLTSPLPGTLRVICWKGYEDTGLSATALPMHDLSAWRSIKFEVRNRYAEPFSVFVRLSNRADHPANATYTGGTFDGYVIGLGISTVEISLEDMRTPLNAPIDASAIAWLGIDFAPLFLRDGQDLRFRQDTTFDISHLRLDAEDARTQTQPYGDRLFATTVPALVAKRHQVEAAIDRLNNLIEQARGKGIETAYAEIYPYLADLEFRSRLVAFWQDRARMQSDALDTLLDGAQNEAARLQAAALAGSDPIPRVPPVPPYSELRPRNGYFRQGDAPRLLFGMDYNSSGPLLRWFADAATDYGTQLVAGATRSNVERQPIWQAYQRYPDTHRVGWQLADHIVRDADSWEVVGPVVNVCLEVQHSRDAIVQAIAEFERAHAHDTSHLVQNLGFEYFYVCYCQTTARMWRDWLTAKYTNITAANRVWNSNYASFDTVPMPRVQTAASVSAPPCCAQNRALWFDWASFNLARFMRQLRWTHDQVRRSEPAKPLTVGSPYYSFSPRFWTAVDTEELIDSDIADVALEENYELDTLMPEYLHALAGGKPVADFEYHGVIHQILPSFLHGDAAISMWWWNDQKHWTPHEPINEWTTSFPQSYTIPLSDLAKTMRDALDLRRLNNEIVALANAPRPVALLYSKTSMLQHTPERSESDTFPFLFYLRELYNASQATGAYVGLTTEKRILENDLSRRKLLVIPAAEFVPQPVVDRILRWVDDGGTLVVSPDALLADEYARPSQTLALLGLKLLAREPASLKRGETQVTEYNREDLTRMRLVPAQSSSMAELASQLQAAGARQLLVARRSWILATFAAGHPAILRIPRGRGKVYWLASPLEPESWTRFLSVVEDESGASPRLQLSGARYAPGLEFRVTDSAPRLAYFYNDTDEPIAFTPQPSFRYTRVIDRRLEREITGRVMRLPAHETAIVEFR